MQDGNAAWWIVFWWLAFAGSHMVLSSTRVRPTLVAKLGSSGFAGLYSLVAFATFVPLVWVYLDSRHTGPELWSLRAAPGAQLAAVVLGTGAFAVLVASFVQPSPAGMDPRAEVMPHGLTRITRHPMLVAFILWAAGHLIVNGFATDVAFFGGMALYSIIGAMHQDARKRTTRGEELAAFYRETSLFPFTAIISGRGRLVTDELPWAGFIVGAIVGYLIYWLHPLLFG